MTTGEYFMAEGISHLLPEGKASEDASLLSFLRWNSLLVAECVSHPTETIPLTPSELQALLFDIPVLSSADPK